MTITANLEGKNIMPAPCMVWNPSTLAWELMQQPMLEVATANVNVNLEAIEALLTAGNIDLAALNTKTHFPLQVARGLVSGISGLNKFGAAPNGVQTTASDIWSRCDSTPTQQIWLAPTQARVHAIVSSSAADVAGGTGATSVTIYGLTSWTADEVSETVNLNGTNSVNTANSYVIIHRMSANASASTTNVGVNAGTITATAASDATVTAVIIAGDGQTEMAIYGIPSTKSLYITRWLAQIDRTSLTVTCDFELRINENPNVQLKAFKRKHDIGLITTGSSCVIREFDPPIKVTGPAIIKVQGIASTNDTDAEASFDGYLVTN